MRTTINGCPVDESGWRSIALTNYGHFTSLMVHDRAVQGLDLHLQRLAAATQELFGAPLDLTRTQAWMREAAADTAGLQSMRVTVFSRAFNRERPADRCAADVLIATSVVSPDAVQAISVVTASYQRESPSIKHVGTFGLFQQKRLAQLRGYDDVVFIDDSGAVSEGSIWNIGFLDDEGVVWPEAEMLDGVSQRLLQCGLAECGISSRKRRIEKAELADFRGAFFTNSRRAVVSMRRIDDVEYAVDPRDSKILKRALDTQPWQLL